MKVKGRYEDGTIGDIIDDAMNLGLIIVVLLLANLAISIARLILW